jgi:ribulose-5-phosphate 4-epimerase/fuculose-1-phosphate aldolase
MTDTTDELRRKVALSCRILANELRDGTGHVSARVPGTDHMLLYCRDGRGGGLLGTNVHHIRRVDFDGVGAGDEYAAPHETPLHGELYQARPEVNAVVHVHPPFGLLCSITNQRFRPIFGGYHPPSLRIALLGVPVLNRAATVTTKELAKQMIDVMGERDIVLLKGHGLAAVGPTVEAATNLAIDFERLAQITWEVARAGLVADEIPPEDLARYDPQRSRERPPGVTREARDLPAADESGWGRYIKALERTVGLPT